MTDGQNGSGGDTEANRSDSDVLRMWQKLHHLPGGDKDPFEDTVAHLPNGLVRAGTSPDTGRPMYTTTADAPLTYTFNEAAEYAQQLNAKKFLGHADWRVPTKGELNVLFNNRAAIWGFDENGLPRAGWYWSSPAANDFLAWAQLFSDGYQSYTSLKITASSLRCVRG